MSGEPPSEDIVELEPQNTSMDKALKVAILAWVEYILDCRFEAEFENEGIDKF